VFTELFTGTECVSLARASHENEDLHETSPRSMRSPFGTDAAGIIKFHPYHV